MGYKALITIDLPNASGEQRQKFYNYLKEKNWHKIEKLTTTWRVYFKEDVTRLNAISAIKNPLNEALQASDLESVEYALQLSKKKIVVDNI